MFRAENRELERAWADWLAPVPWSVIGHARFPVEVTEARADRTMMRFLNELEVMQRSRVGAVWSRECVSKSTAAYVGQHFHFVAASLKTLDPEAVECVWRRLVHGPAERDRVLVQVDPFQADRDGIAYCLKRAALESTGTGDRNLEYFHPALTPRRDRSHRASRAGRRWKRMQAAALTPPAPTFAVGSFTQITE